MSTHRVNIGGEIRFFEATEDKPAAAYVRLAEGRRERDPDGQWVDGEPRWYDAKFTGVWAKKLVEEYQKGDPLIVSGDTVKHTRETADGRSFQSTKLYVEVFGPDPVLAKITLTRGQGRAPQAQAAPQQAVQEAEAEAEREPERVTVQGRIGELVEAGRLTQQQNDDLLRAVNTAEGDWRGAMEQACRSAGLPQTESLYLMSAAMHGKEGWQQLNWEESEAAAQQLVAMAERAASPAPGAAPASTPVPQMA